MPVKIQSYGGPIIWLLRKFYSQHTSSLVFSVIAWSRHKVISKYIALFENQEKSRIPVFKFLMFETINRCNGKCEFCPANVKDEVRPYMIMDDMVIDRILDNLVDCNWNGTIFPQVNNEPFIDSRIVSIIKKCKEKRPDSKIHVITNGTLLTTDILMEISELVDVLDINDYSDHYKLSHNIANLYKYVKSHNKYFDTMNITIVRRYSKEILSTRAGYAPNKHEKNNKIESPCIYPYTDLIIYPNGNVGMCCNDCLEATNMGNVMEKNLWDIWTGQKFTDLRVKMKDNRSCCSLCNKCDVVDAGSREVAIRTDNM